MSISQASTGSLLRRPLRPQQSDLSAAISHRSSETRLSNNPRMLPAMRPMPSIASHQDGMQSPVPTMQSEYDPVTHPQRSKQKRGRSNHNDSEYATSNGDTGDSLSKKGLVLPYKPRGPDPFPMREPKRPADVKREYILPNDGVKAPPDFALDDFLLKTRPYGIMRKSSLKAAVLSRANYKKLTLLLQQELTEYQTSIGTVDISKQAEVQTPHKRIPKNQLILEMKKVVQERLTELGVTSPGKFNGHKVEVSKLYEEIQDIGDSEGVGRKTQLSLFNKATSAVFQAHHERTGSSFDGENTESIITPSELSILNCLMEGGYVLSLKAHFIPQIPELSPLSTTLVYLNLSFNELVNFPRDVLACRELQVLKLRNNPLKDIPHDISKLKKLRTLILSFCCLTALPLSLFTLTKLEFFDVSYNKLTFLANEIKKLEKLRFLNVEGNELAGLPCGLLRLNLFRIRVRNNFMNPLFWKENSANDPQRLTDMCLVVIKSKVTKDDPRKMEKFPPEIVRAINSFLPCDCCDGSRFGPGLRIIRPCTEIWGIKRLPFVFQSCSPSCYSTFIHNIDPQISELLYGMIDDKSKSPVVEERLDDEDSLGEAPPMRDGAITA